MMLYPDMTRTTYDASDYFVFAAPCTQAEWFQLSQQISRQWKGRKKTTPQSRGKNDDYLAWIMLKDDSEEEIVIILRDTLDTDSECEETAAWIRVSQEFRGMVYALKYDPAYGSEQTLAQIICRTAGVNPSQVRQVVTQPRGNNV